MTSSKFKKTEYNLQMPDEKSVHAQIRKAVAEDQQGASADQEQPEESRLSHGGGFTAFMHAHMTEFMISIALHSVMMFLLILMSGGVDEGRPEVTIIQKVEEEKAEEPPPKPEEPKLDMQVKEKVEEVSDEVTDQEELVDVPIPQPTDQPETDTAGDSDDIEMKAVMAGTTGETSDIPEGIQGPGGVGFGREDGGGLPHGYKSRGKKGKAGAIRRHGGAGSESVVEIGLKWLMYHQEYDGSWDASKYEGIAPFKEAMTSIALLAFLGAGYSENIGPYKTTVRKGIAWLNQRMNEVNGGYANLGNNYAISMMLMALSEASIFGSKAETKANANKLADYFMYCYNGKGWRYYGNSVDDDQSASGWVALGLKSAKAAELEVMQSDKSKKIMDEYKEWVKTMTEENTGKGIYEKPPAFMETMMWVGMFQRQFLGFPKNDPYLSKASDNTLNLLAGQQWLGGDVPGDVYGIYYGTLAAFQQQGNMWKAWNPKMKHTLMASQRKGDPKLMGGSWDPTKALTGEQGGRVITTAMFCLCLEVYFRYEMMN